MKIGIIAAMQEELAALIELLIDYSKESEHSRYNISNPILEWHCGKLNTSSGAEEVEIIALQSGIGKAQAALHTGLLLQHHKVDCIVNIGSAGGLMADGQHGDIVIADSLCYHDADVRAFGYAYGQLPGNPNHFPTAPQLREMALKIANDFFSNPKNNNQEKANKAIIGPIISGDTFVEYGNPHLAVIQQHFPLAKAVEMEAAAIAHIAFLYGCPCLIVRSISDFPLRPDGKVDFKRYLPLAAANSATIVQRFINKFASLN